MAILVVFKMAATENTKEYITLLVIDLYKQTCVKIYILKVQKSNGDVL